MTTETSWREELVRRLEASPPLLETFVLLWSYFEEAGLRLAEDRLSELKIHQLDPETSVLQEGTRVQKWLQEQRRTLLSLAEGEFDRVAVEWLRSIDELMEHKRVQLHQEHISGLDSRKSYRVHRRREILAERLEGRGKRPSAWVGEQNDAIEAYTKFHKAVRANPVKGYQIITRTFGRQEQSKLRARLDSDWEDGHFLVMLWPFETRLKYPGLGAKDLSQGPGKKVNFVHLREIENEAELIAEIPRMLTAAREKKVTLLLLPELAVPPAAEEEIRRFLSNRDDHGHPLLTLFGRCHRRIPDQDLDVNEAILLGPDGTDVHCHRKLVPYTGRPATGENYLSENLKRGDNLTVLELPFGNLSVVICMDLFRKQSLLEDSHATVLAVPSLSRKTSAHKYAAIALANKNRACTFVTNRWVYDTHPWKATSFYQLPIQDEGYKAHIEEPKGDQAPPCPPYLLFTLP